MFTVAKRKKFIRELRRPLRLKELRERAVDLMKGSGYQSVERFIAALEDEGIIQMHTVEANNGRNIPTYCSASLLDIGAYELATSVLPGGYFCNLTAVYHHSLTNQVPRSVYWCYETIASRKRRRKEKLSDARTRGAFVKPPRYTSFVIEHAGHDIVVIDRVKGTGYGVEQVGRQHSPCPTGASVASLERTLIDAVVSPHYNGGLTSLCDYFRAAHKKLDLGRMLEIYRQLDFVYPYAQSLGFFLKHSGMKQQADDLRSVYPPRQRFYVDHSAKTTWSYDEQWMLFYPKGLVNED